MIYFVDEDFRKLRVLMSELVIRGYQVRNIRDADSAYKELSVVSLQDTDLVVIDVMLATNSSHIYSRYSREKTCDYHMTGLLLLDDLVMVNPDVFPKRAVYLSHASSDELLAAIMESIKRHKTTFLRKKDYDTAYEFGDEIEGIISKRS